MHRKRNKWKNLKCLNFRINKSNVLYFCPPARQIFRSAYKIFSIDACQQHKQCKNILFIQSTFRCASMQYLCKLVFSICRALLLRFSDAVEIAGRAHSFGLNILLQMRFVFIMLMASQRIVQSSMTKQRRLFLCGFLHKTVKYCHINELYSCYWTAWPLKSDQFYRASEHFRFNLFAKRWLFLFQWFLW